MADEMTEEVYTDDPTFQAWLWVQGTANQQPVMPWSWELLAKHFARVILDLKARVEAMEADRRPHAPPNPTTNVDYDDD